jgi:hypothetical protein
MASSAHQPARAERASAPAIRAFQDFSVACGVPVLPELKAWMTMRSGSTSGSSPWPTEVPSEQFKAWVRIQPGAAPSWITGRRMTAASDSRSRRGAR